MAGSANWDIAREFITNPMTEGEQPQVYVMSDAEAEQYCLAVEAADEAWERNFTSETQQPTP